MFPIKAFFALLIIICICFTKTISIFAENQAGEKYIDPVTDMEFVYINGKCFKMGDTFGDGDIDEMPVHDVCVNDFFMGKYEVTNMQFRKFIVETGYKTDAERFGKGYAISSKGADDRRLHNGVNWKHPLWPSDKITEKMDHPVVQVSWYDVHKFISWLNKKTNKRFRLPTEAEWEFSARSGGKNIEYSWGNGNPSGNIADKTVKKFRKYINWQVWEEYNDRYVYTSPVGKFKPNELGIYDLAGNVSEWCYDIYGGSYYQKSAKNNPKGMQKGVERVLRGGSWNFKPHFLRCSNRMPIFPNTWSYYIGFRLVMDP